MVEQRNPPASRRRGRAGAAAAAAGSAENADAAADAGAGAAAAAAGVEQRDFAPSFTPVATPMGMVPVLLPPVPPPRTDVARFRAYLVAQSRPQKPPAQFRTTPRSQRFAPAELDVAQAAEAAAHQQDVDRGTCWVHIFAPSERLLPDSVGGSSDIANRVGVAAPLWSGETKARFFELLGRRGAARLPEIAVELAKPVLECSAYLDAVRAASRAAGVQIDRAEIPAAEEVPPQFCEPTLDEVALDPDEVRDRLQQQLLRSRRMRAQFSAATIFTPSELARLAAKPVDAAVLPLLERIVRDQLLKWIRVLLRLLPLKYGVKIKGGQLRRMMRRNARLFAGFHPLFLRNGSDGGSGGGNIDSDSGSDVDSDVVSDTDSNSDISPDMGSYTESDSNTDSDTDSESTDQLCVEETAWLDKLDAFNSQLDLYARGYIHFLTTPPPPPRADDLVAFMRTL